MFKTDQRGHLPVLLLLGVVATGISVWACSVPVFRYALEHWAADPYQAVVFHRGPLSPSEQALVLQLGEEGLAGRRHANLSLLTFDLAQDPPTDVSEFWDQLGAETVPWLVVRYPARLPGNVWSGPLTEQAIHQVIDSPARAEVAKRLGQGESAVWVLLEIGEKEKDDRAGELLKSRLDYLSTVLELPTLEEQDIVNGLVSLSQDDLKLGFSVLRVSRTDPKEQAFVKMLLGTEADLNDILEPMAFPIFGRGRALYALVGKGINHETIDEAATFLIGRCSCQVKDLNPGVDLLFAANWDQSLKSQPSTTEELPEAPQLAEAAPVTVKISGEDPGNEPVNSTSASGFRSSAGLLAGLCIGGLMLAGILLFRRR